jgi:hypothetical protein
MEDNCDLNIKLYYKLVNILLGTCSQMLRLEGKQGYKCDVRVNAKSV